MMSQAEMATIVTRKLKDLGLEIARTCTPQWGVSADEITGVITGSMFGLGVTMMHESGYTEDQIVELVRRLVGDLSAPPDKRGAS